MTALRSRRLHTHVWGTVLVVVVTLTGAGLAVAADLPHNTASQPPATTRPDTDLADAAARPSIDALADELRTADQHIAAVAAFGREALEHLQAMDFEAMRVAIARGDQANADLDAVLPALSAANDSAVAAVNESRLGAETAARFAALTAAASSAEDASAYWPAIRADILRIAAVADTLQRHDTLVFSATTYGRRAEWKKALDYLDQAAAPLAEARATQRPAEATREHRHPEPPSRPIHRLRPSPRAPVQLRSSDGQHGEPPLRRSPDEGGACPGGAAHESGGHERHRRGDGIASGQRHAGNSRKHPSRDRGRPVSHELTVAAFALVGAVLGLAG